MSILAESATSTQDLAHQAVASHFIRRLATEIYRFDRRVLDAELSELDPQSQQIYLQNATLVALMTDHARLRPALYDAADQLVPGGLGSLARSQRRDAVHAFSRAFQVLKQHLIGERNPDRVAAMRTLAEADRVAEVN